MELARVFAESGIEFEATLVFMAVAGEEYGLLGARAHAKRMKEEKVPIQALFNNDIVGNSKGGNGILDGGDGAPVFRGAGRFTLARRWRSSRDVLPSDTSRPIRSA